MKIAPLFGGRPMPQIRPAVVAGSLVTAACAVAATLIISADGGSLHATFIDVRNYLLALLGG